MQTVAQPLPITPSIDQLARIIGNVAAPAFLLGAVAALISVLMSRLNRVIDRSQFIYSIPKGDAGRSFSRPIWLGTDTAPRSEQIAILGRCCSDPHRADHHCRLCQRHSAPGA